ncbi:Baseplate J-like protein [Parageobacillus caldoxylosilyticus]|uniref:baseplate J/gp47 family protein n=1 Tax=Saccharococcus caldoxylosilyticus TaxID=81408 RepID=UPI001C4E131E|nr:baseplate J/gp47 family protein [Parageobacillus caldoxylosilyticus]QXJ39598.1 Baseplate J-like protein [Parageobacillus caldoxylosilyticus]
MLDKNGFKRKRYSDLIDDMTLKAKELFGEDINVSEKSFLGILIRLFAWFLAIIWEVAEKVYNSRYMHKAEGIQLDRKAWQFGITRLQEQHAQGTIEIRGTPGFVVEEGTLFETENGILFELAGSVTLDENGVGTGTVVCTEVGSQGNVAANTITIVSNPNENIISVTNPEPVTGGRERETDAEFVERYQQTLAGLGSTTVDSIRGELLKINGVRAAVVIENDESTPDEAGRPPHSLSTYVLGGDPQEIAQAIFKKKAGGIKTHGTEQVEVLDMAGNPHTIRFSWVTEVPIAIQATIHKNDSFPADGVQQIKTQFIKYIGGEDADGTFYTGLNAGETVVVFKLLKQLDEIEGIDDVELLVGIKGQPLGTENIPIDVTQVAQISHTDIEVQVV